MADVGEVDLGGDQQSRARAWATEQVRRRTEELQLQEQRFAMAHPWKVEREIPPPGVVPLGDLYIITDEQH